MTNLSVRCGEVDHRKAVNERSSKEPHFLNLQNIYIHIYIAKDLSFMLNNDALNFCLCLIRRKEEGRWMRVEEGNGG